MYFAVDEIDRSFSKHLIDELALIENENIRTYALIDFSFQLARENQSLPAWIYDGISIYENTALESLRQASPYLFFLPKDPLLRSTHLQRMVEVGTGAPMISFVSSALDIYELRDSLRSHLEICVDNGQKFIFRFADTRILPGADLILSREQITGWRIGIESWIYPGRNGHLLKLSSQPTTATSHESEYINISQSLFDELLEQSEADAIIDSINDQNSDILLNRNPSDIYFFVNNMLPITTEYEVTHFHDLVAFCTTAIVTFAGFHKHPAFQQVLISKLWHPGKLADSFLSLDDRVWDAISTDHIT
jgi:hypothetical protein